MNSLQLVHIITTKRIKNGSYLFVAGLSRELLCWWSQWYQSIWSIKIVRNYWVGI